MFNKNILALSLCAFAVSALVTSAGARPPALAPGGSIGVTGITIASDPSLAGTVLVDRNRPFEYHHGSVLIRGTVQDRVVRETSGGKVDFYTRITLDPASTGQITTLRRSGFSRAGSLLDVNWRMDGLGEVGPASAERTPDGSYVSFGFTGGLAAGASSRLMYVRTNAAGYSGGGAIILRWQSGGQNGAIDLGGYQVGFAL